MDNIERLLTTRELVDKYQTDPELSVSVMGRMALQSELEKLGFLNIKDFQRFNDEMCLEEIKRCTKYISGCDLCKGKPRIGCVQAVGDCGWFDQQSKGGTVPIQPDITRAVEHNKQWAPTTPDSEDMEVGDQVPIMPGCSIMYEIIAKYRFNVMYQQPRHRVKKADNYPGKEFIEPRKQARLAREKAEKEKAEKKNNGIL